jgi:hypothetical protein
MLNNASDKLLSALLVLGSLSAALAGPLVARDSALCAAKCIVNADRDYRALARNVSVLNASEKSPTSWIGIC